MALVDWRHFTKQIDVRQAQSADLKRRIDERTAALERDDAEALELERRIEAGARHTREIEVQASAVRGADRGVAGDDRQPHARGADLQQEISRIREQLAAMDRPERDGTGDEFRDVARQLQSAETELAAIVSDCGERGLAGRSRRRSELHELRSEHEPMRAKLGECLRGVARLDEHISEREAEQRETNQRVEQHRERLAELAGQREVHTAELDRDQKAEAGQMLLVEQHRTSLAAAERRLVEVRRDLGRADTLHRRLDGQLTRVRERIAVLSELEARLEGLDGGVQEILRVAREDAAQRLGDVRGVVADLFHVDVDSAPLVEVALGERAQFIVVTSTSPLLEWLHGQPLKVGSRVGFLGLESRYSLARARSCGSFGGAGCDGAGRPVHRVGR